ncbi:MAG: BNR domain-containing protein [Gammaproteobacteria bacterium]|nr:BNR domain-containing protein [Gammaproteobacteria bacterium]MBU2138570.1 BNR domain-containing protein [Gammaproteobacteria bacterium]MBU2324265.1 BNR domain-containing protein [Gammaproteobacteria bacterium]
MKRLQQLGCVLLALASPLSQAQSDLLVGDVLSTSAMPIAQAQQAVFIDLARAGERLVAVGERGLVLLSDDHGQSWRQARVPVSVSLTAVQFADARHGWAVGHAGVILATRDAGETWQVQLSGVQAAQLELDAARRELADSADPEAGEARLQTAERLVAEGPDKPFLALAFTDAQHGLVVGAYGIALATDDAGATWHSLVGRIDNPLGLHLYAVARQGDDWFLAGEQGYLARSADAGRSFQMLESPYAGTFFTLASGPDGALLVAGLKGHAFISHDRGERFDVLPVPVPVSFSDASALQDGRVLLANQGGMLFRSTRAGALKPFGKPLGMPVSSLVQAADGSLIVAGFTGLSRLPLHDTPEAE